jgi:hypothetical protein
MARKDDLKLLFNFMIELLKDEQETNNVKEQTNKYEEPNLQEKQILTEKQDDSTKHILEVMKRAELMDKMRTTVIARPKLIPSDLRDDDEIAENDREVIDTHKAEKKNKNIKNILSEAKDFMDDLETKKPLVPSVPLHELAEKELAKSVVKTEEEK